MPKWLKITIGALISLIIILTAVSIVFYNMLKSSLPEYEGKTFSEKISDDILIYRDSMAIPYIISKDEKDAAFALGYVHAQERLFQMDLIRRAGKGKLSEIFGTKTIPFDKMFRTVGIERTVKKNIKQMSSDEIHFLQSYSDGVNKFLNDHKGKYPAEFDILNYDPDPWTPEDCLITGKMMAWELNIGWWVDIAFTRLVQKLGKEKIMEILPDYPENAPYVIPPELKNYPKINSNLIQTDKSFRKFMGILGTHIGSNNWAVNGKMSVTGKPIIANDTHLAYSAPGKWFAVVIKSDSWNCAGFTLPGIPAVVIGKNENISWTVTNIMEDDVDFYIEKLDVPAGQASSSKKNFYYNEKWENINIIKDTIQVKDSASVPIKIYSTKHGPIISNIHPFDIIYPGSQNDSAVISMHWLGNYFSDEFLTFYKINKAKNFSEFKESFKTYAAPAQNFVYADKEGNIGYVFGGKIPIRELNSPSFIYDGTTGKYDWKGFVPQNQLPVLFNPQENFIATANNKVDKNFKYYISNIWEPPSRIERITHLLKSKAKHSVKDYKKYQTDFISPYAKKITNYILKAFEGVEINDKNLMLALDLFKEWNFEMNQYSQVPAIYSVFYKYLLKNIYSDEMDHNLFNEFVFTSNIPYRSVLELFSDSTNSWFDIKTTPQTENKFDIIRKSLSDALTELELRFGKDLKLWQWGKLHKVIFKHTFSGKSSLIDKFINIGPYSIGGDGTTIFNTEYPFYESIKEFPNFSHDEFENTVGPSMRYIFDFSKPDEFYMILTTGESGNVMSDHYKDMSKMWLEGKYITVKTDLPSIKRNKNLLEIQKSH